MPENIEVKVATLSQKVEDLTKNVNDGFSRVEKKIDEVCEEIRTNYVTQHEFKPIRMVVYGLVGTALIGVIGALLSLIF